MFLFMLPRHCGLEVRQTSLSLSREREQVPNQSWAAWTYRPAEQPQAAVKHNVKGGLTEGAKPALTTLAGNRCLSVLCCGVKQTLSYTRTYADKLGTLNTEPFCFLCFEQERAGLLRSGTTRPHRSTLFMVHSAASCGLASDNPNTHGVS